MFLRTFTAAIAIAVALASGVCYAQNNNSQGNDQSGSEDSLIQQGFAISPIPKDQLRMAGKDPDLVGLGAYLVNAAADCNGCHSFPRFLVRGDSAGSNAQFTDPYLGNPTDQTLTDAPLRANFNIKHFLAGGRCFGGFMSYNITPDASGMPLGLTEAEFIRVLRTGEDIHCEKNPSDPICALGTPGANPNELQTMSWPTYHAMTDRHIKAIYAYLSSIPHAEACNTPLDGCPGFGVLAGKSSYQYPNTADCPNPPTPQ